MKCLYHFLMMNIKKIKVIPGWVRLGNTTANVQRYGLITGAGILITTNDGYINLSEKDR